MSHVALIFPSLAPSLALVCSFRLPPSPALYVLLSPLLTPSASPGAIKESKAVKPGVTKAAKRAHEQARHGPRMMGYDIDCIM